MSMAPTDKLAIIGSTSWAGLKITKSLAQQNFTQPIRLLVRDTTNLSKIPDLPNIEIDYYSWDEEGCLERALQGIDILLSFIGHEGLAQQKRLIGPMKRKGVKLFVPSDLALPYTEEERETVEVPRSKWELEQELEREKMGFLRILAGNLTSFALDSPYMGVDLPSHRILHTGASRTNRIWLCSLDYVAAAYVNIFFNNADPIASLAGQTIGLNELVCSTGDIQDMMYRKRGRDPAVARESVEHAKILARGGRLDGLVRKKMGDGSHGVGDDIWDVKGFKKRTLEDFILGEALERPRYIEPSEETRTFLDEYFERGF